jgi:hypothetical protein
VISRDKPSKDLAYTLSCYCPEQFTLSKPANDLEYYLDLRSSWGSRSAAGPYGSPTYRFNPSFAVSISGPGNAVLQFVATTAKSSAVNVVMLPVDFYGDRSPENFGEPVVDTGNYEYGFVASEKVAVAPGNYVVVVSNYFPGQSARFILKVMSSRQILIEEVVS